MFFAGQDAVRKSTALGLEDLAAAALSQLAKAQMALGQSEARGRVVMRGI